MAEYILGINFSIFWPILFLVLALEIIAVKRILFAWFDPISLYVFMSSFGISFMIYMCIDKEVSMEDLVPFLISTICFFIGMNLGDLPKKKVRKHTFISQKTQVRSISAYSGHLYVFMCISLVILLVTSLILISIFGTLPLFAPDIDIAKVAARGPGLGIIYRINNALLPTSLAIVLTKIFNPLSQVKKNQYIALYIPLILLLLFLLSSGDKGSILVVTNILAFLFLANVRMESDRGNVIPKMILAFLGVGIAMTILLLAKAATAGNYTSPLDGLVIRFLASGESFYYYYKFNLIQRMSSPPLDYFTDALNPFFSLLKLSEYKEALGSKLITEGIGLDVGKFGTNPNYQVEGAIYFGAVGSFLYSFLIGYSLTRVRKFLLEKSIENPNQLNLVIYCLISSHFTSLPIDSTLLYVTVYSIIVVAMPIFIIISVVLGPQLSRAEK
jgi:hypothetical protein